MKKPSRFRVGLLFLLGLLMSVGVLIWIGAASFFRNSKTYDAYFDSSVQGLGSGADVTYRGIKVGRVKSKELAPDQRLVKVEVAIDRDFQVRDDQALSMAQEGLTGSPYLSLATPPEGAELVKPPFDFEPEHDVLPTYAGGRQRIMGAIADLSKEIGSLPLDELVQHWSSAGKQLDEVLASKDIDRTLANLRAASADAEKVLGVLAKPGTRNDVKQALADLSASADSIREASGTLSRQLGALPPDALGELSGDMQDAVGGLQVALRRIDALVPKMGALVRKLRQQPGQITVRRKQQEPFDR